jgi:predicted Holliday junction resolvase-like endonuclease
MDAIDKDREKWEEKITDYQEKGKEIRRESIGEARRTQLPKRLKTISPLFAQHKIRPDDIKVVSHPVNFVGFDGLITNEDLKRIVLLDSKANGNYRKSVQNDIKKIIERDRYDWNTYFTSR